MALIQQTQNVLCSHNHLGQVLKAGVMIPCRGCGALLEPSAVAGNTNATNASYPGNHDAAHISYVFSK